MRIGNIDVIDLRSRYPSNYAPRELSLINSLSIHHSVNRNMPVYSSTSEEIRELDLIHAYHKGKFRGIAYPLVVFPSGNQYLTGDWDSIRYVVGGQGNVYTLSVLLHGTFIDEDPGQIQLESTQELLDNVRMELMKPQIPLYGHKDFVRLYPNDPDVKATACPGTNFNNWGLH